MKPKLSVCIPIYNAEKYLDKCLETVSNQTIENYEIICVNDGSTDNSKKIIEKYQKKHKNIKLINQENGGVNKARIVAYKNASGEYIAWVDADDFVELNMFEKLYSAAKNGNFDIAMCNYNFYPNKVINKQKWFNEYKGELNWKFVYNNTVQWNKIVKKTLLDSLDICNLFETVGEGCYSLVLISTKKIISINECLYNYRVGHTSLSSNFENIEWYKKTVERAKNKYLFVKDNNYDEEWIEFFNYIYLYYVLILLIVSAYNSSRKDYLSCQNILTKEQIFNDKNSKYLKYSFSLIKIFVLKNYVYKNYMLARIICKVILK